MFRVVMLIICLRILQSTYSNNVVYTCAIQNKYITTACKMKIFLLFVRKLHTYRPIRYVSIYLHWIAYLLYKITTTKTHTLCSSFIFNPVFVREIIFILAHHKSHQAAWLATYNVIIAIWWWYFFSLRFYLHFGVVGVVAI